MKISTPVSQDLSYAGFYLIDSVSGHAGFDLNQIGLILCLGIAYRQPEFAGLASTESSRGEERR